MAQPPFDFSRPAQLRSGTPVLIRAIRPDDRERIIAAFHKLDQETIYTRFFSAKKELSADDLGRIEASDFVHAAVLVATLGSGADETIIGGGAYTVIQRPDGVLTAELSFTIEEDYHGQGLSTLFMALLTEIGRAARHSPLRGRGAGRQHADAQGLSAQRPADDPARRGRRGACGDGSGHTRVESSMTRPGAAGGVRASG